MKKNKVEESFQCKFKNQFYSICRNFNNFEDITNEEIECAIEIADSIRNKYDNYSRESIYFKYLHYISENYHDYQNKDMLPLILIKTVDPSLNIYKIYENCSRIKDIKLRMKLLYGFDDIDIIKFEKAYISKFLDINDFSFTKRLEI